VGARDILDGLEKAGSRDIRREEGEGGLNRGDLKDPRTGKGWGDEKVV